VTRSRPARLTVGDQVHFDGGLHTVRQLSGGTVVLADVTGNESSVEVATLFSTPGFTVITTTAATRVPLPARGPLEGLPPEVRDKALWWEQHLIEVLSGVPPEAGPGARARPEYDPHCRTLRQREIAKVSELAAAGSPIPLTSFQRMRRGYARDGVLGLVDGRSLRDRDTTVDDRVLAAVRQAVTEQTNGSTGTVSRLQRRVSQILAAEHGIDDPTAVMPSRATFYRLVDRMTNGLHTFGSAPTRRSLAQRPGGPFGTVTSIRPGEWVLVDSTPLDVRVVLDDGTVDRVELTWLLDLATRSLPAAVLRPSTKAVDASLLLARCLTPEPMRPGWADALRMSRSALPYRRLADIDARLEHAAARPVITPETIVCDHGMVYLSASFKAACRAMGVTFQPTHAGSPWEKGGVERSFGSVATLFTQYVKGYVGRSVDRRGKDAETAAAWSIVELQDLLDEWIVAHWQNRPHDGLRHPQTPGKALTPNEQYAALIEVAGYIPVPLSGDDYIELLPATWRVINSYGIKISHRTYDCKALNPYRRQSSGIAARKGRWEVHYDPYDVTRVWVRNHHEAGWINAPWTHLRSAPAPFGDQAWKQAQQIVARRGTDPATESEIADAVTTLLDKAEQGPDTSKKAPKKSTPTKRDRRVAARTRATTTAPSWPRPAEEVVPEVDGSPDSPAEDEAEATTSSTGLAQVIPLGVFDARREAEKWW